MNYAKNRKKSYPFNRMKSVKTISIIAFCLFGLANNAFSSEPIKVLGLSLGGKFPESKVCSFNEIGNDHILCWVDQPFTYKGQKSGVINLPGSGMRPKWAANASFHVLLNKRGELSKIEVRTSSSIIRTEIMSSIESRFGLPTDVTPVTDRIQAADWRNKEAVIRVLCSRTIGCKVTFSSVEADAELQAELKARAAKNNARPTSP